MSYNYSQTNYEESYPMASTGHLDSQREAAEKALDTQKVQTVYQGTTNLLHAVVCIHVHVLITVFNLSSKTKIGLIDLMQIYL